MTRVSGALGRGDLLDHAERQRRQLQFSDYLRSMNRRTHEEAGNSSFMLFEVGSVPGRDDGDRFIQFAFEDTHFYMDLPSTTLSREEGTRIARRRKKFFYLADREDMQAVIQQEEEELRTHNPLCALYVYGKEDEAAEDMCFVFFDIWGLPTNSVLAVCAASFNGRHGWEQGEIAS